MPGRGVSVWPCRPHKSVVRVRPQYAFRYLFGIHPPRKLQQARLEGDPGAVTEGVSDQGYDREAVAGVAVPVLAGTLFPMLPFVFGLKTGTLDGLRLEFIL